MHLPPACVGKSCRSAVPGCESINLRIKGPMRHMSFRGPLCRMNRRSIEHGFGSDHQEEERHAHASAWVVFRHLPDG